MAIADLRRERLNPPPNETGRSRRIEALRRLPLFTKLPRVALDRLADSVVFARYRQNQVLFVEGEPCNALYFVLSGRVKVYRDSYDGRELVVNVVGKGEILAPVPFCDGGAYPANGQVLEDAELAFILAPDFRVLARAYPDILFELLAVLGRRLRRAQAEIYSLSLRNVTARLAFRLLEMAERYGEPVEDGIEIDLKLSRQELGSLIGSSRESTTRSLQQFQKEEVIRIDGSRITILKPAMLRSWSEV